MCLERSAVLYNGQEHTSRSYIKNYVSSYKIGRQVMQENTGTGLTIVTNKNTDNGYVG